MIDIDCPKQCCNARYCPLVLAWATTVHKFQGFEAGFEKDDHINHIIADINNLNWEKQHPGTAYVVASRAKTIGQVTEDIEYPTMSNLFFTGTMGTKRFKKMPVQGEWRKMPLSTKTRSLGEIFDVENRRHKSKENRNSNATFKRVRRIIAF